jgi:hypothetical protein
MDDREKDEYISSMIDYMHSIKDHPIARRKLLMDAGIIDSSGNLTDQYKFDGSIVT